MYHESQMTQSDRDLLDEAIRYNTEHGHQKRIGVGHAASPQPRIDPRTCINQLPPWLRHHLKNNRGDFVSIEYLKQFAAEIEGNVRNQQWLRARKIAAWVCATQAAGGDTNEAISGWGLKSSQAWKWVSLARCFPDTLENPQISSNFYYMIFQLAKLELQIKGRPRTPEQWTTVSDMARDMFEEFETYTEDQLRKLLNEKKELQEPQVEAEDHEDEEQRGSKTLMFKAWVDQKGRPRVYEDGSPGPIIDLKKILEDNGVTDQEVEIVIRPTSTHDQRRML